MSPLYPMLVRPRFDERIWGGDALAARFGKDAPRVRPVGESWEVYDENPIANGIYAGLTIAQLRAEMGSALMGHLPAGRPFPLLTKLIDARDVLSVQVHPDDRAAQRLEHQPNGKTECWYVIDAEPGAELVYGFARDTGPDEYQRLVESGELQEILRSLPVEPGDVVYIPAGTVHAIGAGIVLYEVQQTSDVTYRIYDWNRRDDSGKPRELHVDRAKQVLDFHRWTQGKVRRLPEREGRQPLVAGPYFALELVTAGAAERIATGASPVVILALDQPLEILTQRAEPIALAAWSSALVPAGAGSYRLEAQGGNPGPARAIAAWIPRSSADYRDLTTRGYADEEVGRFIAQFEPARDLGITSTT